MYVHWHKPYSKVQLALDCVSLWAIWKLSAYLRICLNPITKLQLSSQDSQGWMPSLILVLALWLAASWRFRLYRPPYRIKFWSICRWAAKETVLVASITIVSVFFSRQFGEGASRMFVLCMVPVSFLLFASTRLVALRLMQNWDPPRIALIGDSLRAKYLVSRFEDRVAAAVRGVIVPEAAMAAAVGYSGATLGAAPPVTAASGSAVPVLGTIGQIAELVNREQIERVIIISGSLTDTELERCNKVFWRMGLPVSHTLGLPVGEGSIPLVRSTHRVNLRRHNGLPIVEIRPLPLQGAQDFVKHAVDLALALLLLVSFWPLLLAIGVAIRLGSDGPALETHFLVGKGGRHFKCFKFRTSYRENDPALAQRSRKGQRSPDDTTTPIGGFLRRYGLDELPQLVNIFAGRMSFVGPRPLPAEALGPDGMSRDFYAWSEARARVRPGLTGLWQLHGSRTDSLEEMIRFDAEYLETRSLWGDLKILLQTPIAVLRGAAA